MVVNFNVHARGFTFVLILSSLMVSSQAHSQSGESALLGQEQISTTLPVTAEGMIIAPVETLGEFRPLVPGHADGPNIREIEGDPMAGPSITLFRYRNDYEGSRRLPPPRRQAPGPAR